MTTNSATQTFAKDDRGAILVMGIFMCACLVTILWYVAGVGQAIVYRERLQEAADAVAFSSAALHARGMNLIVLVNLLMAVILSVRVAIRVAKLALGIAAVVFGALSFVQPQLAPLAATAADAVVELNSIDEETKEPIDGALKGLVAAQDVISAATAPAAYLGATSTVGNQYAPIVVRTTAIPATIELPPKLPVERGSSSKLCKEATEVLGELSEWLLDKAGFGFIAKITKLPFEIGGKLAAQAPGYFCGLEGNSSPPNSDEWFDKGTEDRCKEPEALPCKSLEAFDTANTKWLERCAKAGVSCQSLDPQGQPLDNGVQSGNPVGPDAEKEANVLERLKLERDHAAAWANQTKRSPMTHEQCMARSKADMETHRKESDALDKKQSGGDANGGSSGNASIKPMKVASNFKNGSESGQIFGGALGDDTRLQSASRLVRLGTMRDSRGAIPDIPAAASVPAWAQAEMFYDCAGAWAGCAKDEEPMWNFRWRPRLRRFNQPLATRLPEISLALLAPPKLLGPELFAAGMAVDAANPLQATLWTAGIRAELAKALTNTTMVTRGAH